MDSATKRTARRLIRFIAKAVRRSPPADLPEKREGLGQFKIGRGRTAERAWSRWHILDVDGHPVCSCRLRRPITQTKMTTHSQFKAEFGNCLSCERSGP